MRDTEPPFLEIPPEIVNAAIKVEHWFKQQGIEKWALMGIQSRDPFEPISQARGRDLAIANETITDIKPPRYNTE